MRTQTVKELLIYLCAFSVFICSAYAAEYELIIYSSPKSIFSMSNYEAPEDIKIIKRKNIAALGEKHRTLNFFGGGGPRVEVLLCESDSSQQDVIEALSRQPGVDFVEPNYPIELYQVNLQDPYAYKQAYLKAHDLYKVWSFEHVYPVKVAIVDTGVDLNHEDLARTIVQNTHERMNGKDDDNNGYIDDVNGYSWVDVIRHEQGNKPFDDHGHGTHLAGIIAAQHNNIGIAGVHPEATILPLKVFNSNGRGKQLEAALAIRYAVDNGANIINCSWGYYFKTRVLQEAINYAHKNNVLVVAAMGNSSISVPMYPAGFSSVIAVGSVNAETGRLDGFSNYGSHMDIAVPGHDIFSAYQNNGYRSMSGTSQSAALMSGLFARLYSSQANWNVDDIQSVIRRTRMKTKTGKVEVPNIQALLADRNQLLTVDKFTVSAALSDEKNGVVSKLMVAPNPIKTNQTTIFFEAKESDLIATIRVFDLAGIQVLTHDHITSLGQNSVEILLGNEINNGVYLLLLELKAANTQLYRTKFAILR